MHRIDTPTAQVDKFGAGKNGFTRGNPQTGVPATALDDDYFDAVQEELAGIVEAAGLTLDKTDRAQVLAAIERLITDGIPELKDASLTQKGIVQLSSSTNSASEALAATPKAVKAVSDAGLKIAGNLAEIKAAGSAAVAQALVNLGLTDTAAAAAGAMQKSQNLNDVANKATALTNLGALPVTGGQLTGALEVTGKVTPSDYANFDVRYSPVGYIPPLSRIWLSNALQPVYNTPTIVTHGLVGIDPLRCRCDVLLRCVTAANGYSVGDFAINWTINANGSVTLSPSPTLNATTIQINTGAGSAGFVMNNKSDGNITHGTSANWRYIFRIFY